jgi:hypothetical protein
MGRTIDIVLDSKIGEFHSTNTGSNVLSTTSQSDYDREITYTILIEV